jgi:tRNA G46 methylase TrmB
MSETTKFDPIIPLSGEDFEHVYEPSEDSFLFMDALGKDMASLKEQRPQQVVEIGCGSGCVTSYLAKQLVGPSYLAVDINRHAVEASRRTFEANGVDVELVQVCLLLLPHALLCSQARITKLARLLESEASREKRMMGKWRQSDGK